MRNYSFSNFGPTFGMATLQFLQSGRERFEVPCDTVGQATNLRMRFHQFWKLARSVSQEALSHACGPDLAARQAELGDLTMLSDKAHPRLAIIARKSQRKLDEAVLKALQNIGKPEAQAAAPPSSPSSPNAGADGDEDPMDTALRTMGMVKTP